MADRCGFCGGTDQPLSPVEGAFTVLICRACLGRRARGLRSYPELSDE